jgi:hypothetical protein
MRQKPASAFVKERLGIKSAGISYLSLQTHNFGYSWHTKLLKRRVKYDSIFLTLIKPNSI